MKTFFLLLLLTCFILVSSCFVGLQAQSTKETPTETAFLDSATNLIKASKFDVAKKMLTDFIADNPNNAKAYNMLGNCYQQNVSRDSAKFFYKKAMTLDTTYASPYYNMGWIYMREGSFGTALSAFKQCQILEPDSSYTLFIQGIAYQYMQQQDSAMYYYGQAIEKAPKDPKPYYYRAVYHSDLGQLDAAMKDINKVIELKPKDGDAYYQRGKFLMVEEQLEEAIASFSKCVEIDKGATDALEQRALCYMYSQKYEAAVKDATAVLSQNDKSLNGVFAATGAHFGLKKWQESLKYALIGQEIAPDYAFFYETEVDVYLAKKEYETALNRLEELILETGSKLFYDKKIKTALRYNSDPKVFSKKEYFQDIHAFNTAEMDKWIADNKSPYFYDSLLQKFQASPTKLGLDEFFMLYYGNPDPSASGASPLMDKLSDSPNLQELYGQGLHVKCLQAAKKLLENNPFDLNAYWFAAKSAEALEDMALYEKYMFPFKGFIEGFFFTGDGKSPETAYIVNSTATEYLMVSYMGLRPSGQELATVKDHRFDLINVGTEAEPQKIYFNVDRHWQHLNEMIDPDKLKNLDKK